MDVRRSADRFTTDRPGSTTRHCFSFGPHYDASNVSFGPVVAVNDEVLAPGAGFDEHPHAGLVIVTYVVAGSLAHQGISSAQVEAGQVAVLRTGAGVVHAERNAGPGELRFIQTWMPTDADEVSYEIVDGPVVGDGWRYEVVHPASRVTVGPGHVFVVSGSLDGLAEGDSVRTSDRVTLVPTPDAVLLAVTSHQGSGEGWRG
jgi:mannose-6-phosphate isomerase-like protein (cupin superfamily)